MKRLTMTAILCLLIGTPTAHAQVGTAFTYQGKLTDGGGAANGPYDLEFQLFDAATLGTGSSVQTLDDVAVVNGLFTVKLDFGSAFTGSPRWLEIRVRPGASVGAYTALTPRQELTPSPNAVFSATTGDPSVQRRTVAPSCPAGQYVQSLAADGTPTCVANGGGTVTAVTASGLLSSSGGPAPNLTLTGGATGEVLAGLAGVATWTGSPSLSGNLALANTSGIGVGVVTKGGNPFIHNFGANNTFIGENAGNFSMTGSSNTALGRNALQNNSASSANTATGANALSTNTTGAANTATGFNALFSNTTASNNTALGFIALSANTTGINNTAVGSNALTSNTTGTRNTATGFMALGFNGIGVDNTAHGKSALQNNTSGSRNSAFGTSALERNTTGLNNTAVGFNALLYNETGTGNTAVGQYALENNFNGSSNTAMGDGALFTAALGDRNTALGAGALFTNQVSDNTATGYGALQYNTTGTWNTAHGATALRNNTTGFNNTAVGGAALSSNITGGENTATGQYALWNNASGFSNTANGSEALSANISGNANTGLGYKALFSNTTSSFNTAVGNEALFFNTGANNTGVGGFVLHANTTGTENTAQGASTLLNNTTGNGNTATGVRALTSNITANFNTAVGVNALRFNTTGARNIALGKDAGLNLTTGDDNINIGNTGFAGEAGIIRIGTPGTHTAAFISGVTGVTPGSAALPVVIDGSGQLGTTAALTADNVSGIVAIANGGTGSNVLDFVDLASDQNSIAGKKTLTDRLSVTSNDGVVFGGTVGSGTIPAVGPGARLMWYPSLAAFRAGSVNSNQWDSPGGFSIALGENTTAGGNASTALGWGTTASATASTALGRDSVASASQSTAMGFATTASGLASTSIGDNTKATGMDSTAMGRNTVSSGFGSTAMGLTTTASGGASTAMGDGTHAQAYASTVLGSNNTISGDPSSWIPTDPLFVVGNGFGGPPSDALTLYKNGNLAIAGTLSWSGAANGDISGSAGSAATATTAASATTAAALAANPANCTSGVAAGIAANGAAEGCVTVSALELVNSLVLRDGLTGGIRSGNMDVTQNLSVSGATTASGLITATSSTDSIIATANGANGRAVSGRTNGTTGTAAGIYGEVFGFGPGGMAAVWGKITTANTPNAYAGFFEGRVNVAGNLNVSGSVTKGSGTFKIDHPLDPENKYLYHSFVESPDMMNIYNGNVTTDEKGYATVVLPNWFDALNRDFRYQLSVIDTSDDATFVQAKVVRKISDNRFIIRTSAPRTEVSWQVTGVRQDAYAEANRIHVEEEKAPEDRGLYLYPAAFGLPASRGIDFRRGRRSTTSSSSAPPEQPEGQR